MIRKQWHDEHGSMKGHYGLGIMGGKAGAWEWFGHAGGFQSCLSRTVVLPGRDIAVSILTNALDGPAWTWSDAAIHILQTFEKRGGPSARTRDWAGRWWSMWRTVDLVPMRDHVLVDDPGLAVPFSDASEIAVTGRDSGTIRFAPGIANFGEDARLVRGRNGRVPRSPARRDEVPARASPRDGAQAPLRRLARNSHQGHGLRRAGRARSARCTQAFDPPGAGRKAYQGIRLRPASRRRRACPRDAAGGRLGATQRAALSGLQSTSSHSPDVPRRAGGARTRATRFAALLLCRPDSAAQSMTLVRSAG